MLDRIRAISLDLDDTLWDTWPVLLRAEARLQAWLEERAPRLAAAYDLPAARGFRAELAREVPSRAHDLTWLRTEALRRMARAAGYPESLATEAFDVFHAARNDIECYADVRPALARIAARVPVYALSNGNACVRRVGLGEWFAGAVGAAEAGAAKPDPRIFRRLLELADRRAHEVLHVGDDPQADVAGARAAGLPTAWLNRRGADWPAGLARADREFASLAELADALAGEPVDR